MNIDVQNPTITKEADGGKPSKGTRTARAAKARPGLKRRHPATTIGGASEAISELDVAGKATSGDG